MADQVAVAHTSPITGVVSILSSNEKRGPWELPRHLRALAILGNVEIDLRDAIVGYGLSVIEAVAVLGNIEITVPPEITVECDGDALAGTFALKYEGRVNTGLTNRDRIVRVSGTAYMASVTVTVKGADQPFLERLSRSFKRSRD